LCMFGFPVYKEFARLLKSGGLLVQVDTGVEHLRELREIIYPTQKPDRINEAETPDGFEKISVEKVTYSLSLKGADPIADLLAMTPHFYRASTEGKIKAAALTQLTVTIDVNLTLFTR
jgi:23S rRNA (guanine745-N1)-methyltransferase